MGMMITAEFHCHTVYSIDSSNCIPRLLETARERGIARLAITDHNTIQGAQIAQEMDPELVVVGEEILTTRGELLAYYLQEPVPAGLPPLQAVERLKVQGAFIAVPHPMDRRRHGWQLPDLLEILPDVDALEVFNARCLHAIINQRAKEFAEEREIPGIAGSDAHSLVELGLAVVHMPPFDSAQELRAAVQSGVIEGRLLSPLDHFKASLMIGLGRLNPFKKQ